MTLLTALALAASPWEQGLDVERQHMGILAAWSVGNLAVGGVAAWQAEDPQWQSFHATNAAWNTVNLAIAGLGLVGNARKRARGAPDLTEIQAQHRNLRTALAVNLVLDVVYMGAGAALVVSGGETRGLDHRGVGTGLLVQGGFLATFDAAFLSAHRRIDGPHLTWTPSLVPTGAGPGLGIAGHWSRR